jgi:hypothetical protein
VTAIKRTGYKKSALNALKHGLASEALLLPHENPEILEILRTGILAQYLPSTPAEEHLVEELTATLWRMQRLKLAEKAVFQHHARTKSGNALLDAMDKFLHAPAAAPLTAEEETAETLRRGLLSEDMGKLQRYDAYLTRKLTWALAMLERMQQSRKDAVANTIEFS